MHYHVKAVKHSEGIVGLTIDAIDPGAARQQVERLGYQVLSLKPTRLWAGLRLGRQDRFPLVLFSQELIALVGAGLSLTESLETLAEKEHSADLKRTLEEILVKIREGHTLSAVLEQFPGIFPALYVATVRSSEKTGDLREALSRYLSYHAQLDVVRKKLVSASIYPLVLLGVGGSVMVFLLAYVVPKFGRLYEDVGGNLPMLSQLLLQWGQLIEMRGGEVALWTFVATAMCVYVATRPATRQWALARVCRVPSLQRCVHVYELARFYRTLGMLLRGGMPIVGALSMVAGLLSPGLRSHLAHATTEIFQGQPISHALEQHALTTPVAQRMLRVGERSGQMGEMMERIASFYDEDIARWVDWLTKLIEPILMVVIGLVIGAIVLLMYFPIFELAGSIQ